MRSIHRCWSIPLCVVGATLCSCGEPRIECGTDAVRETLTSIVRDRVAQVVADGLPATLDAVRKAKLAKATWISIRDPRLIAWEKDEGRLKCVATVLMDARLDDRGAYVAAQNELTYRVVSSDSETLLVEVAFADLTNVFSMPANVTLTPR